MLLLCFPYFSNKHKAIWQPYLGAIVTTLPAFLRFAFRFADLAQVKPVLCCDTCNTVAPSPAFRSLH